MFAILSDLFLWFFNGDTLYAGMYVLHLLTCTLITVEWYIQRYDKVRL